MRKYKVKFTDNTEREVTAYRLSAADGVYWFWDNTDKRIVFSCSVVNTKSVEHVIL